MRINKITTVYKVTTDHGDVFVPIDDLKNQTLFAEHFFEQTGTVWKRFPKTFYSALVEHAKQSESPKSERDFCIPQLEKALREYVRTRSCTRERYGKGIFIGKVLVDGEFALFRLQSFFEWIRDKKGWRLSKNRISKGLREIGCTQRGNTFIAGKQIRPWSIDFAWLRQ